jgi:hypothetical protein
MARIWIVLGTRRITTSHFSTTALQAYLLWSFRLLHYVVPLSYKPLPLNFIYYLKILWTQSTKLKLYLNYLLSKFMKSVVSIRN